MQFDLLRRPVPPDNAPGSEPAVRKPLPVQRRLAVGASDDPHEREADRVADDVVRRLRSSDRQPGADAVRTGALSRISRRSAGAADGFEAPRQVERSIEQQRGGGAPLDARTRATFEGAMGADLGDVRIHQDSTANELNRQVSAKAFTTGHDVFFSAGTYAPDTHEGQHLLAHELAHTVQQGGAVQRATIQRLALKNTDFTKTTAVEVFTGGASGCVAKFSDAKGSVIVKVDQLIGNEVAVADKLHGKVGKKQSGKGYGVDAPGSRVASPADVNAIRAATLRCLDATADPRNFLTGLDSPNPVIIADIQTGKKISDLLGPGQTTKTDEHGVETIDDDSVIIKMLRDGGSWRSLAQNVPVDIVMGMGDRLVGAFNAENFLYDEKKKTFKFVDNTQNQSGGFLTSVDLGQAFGVHTNQEAFTAWSNMVRPAHLRDNNLDAIAEEMYKKVIDGINLSHNSKSLKSRFRQIFKDLKPALVGHIKEGLEAGRKKVMAQIKKPTGLVSGVQANKQIQAMQGLLARYYFLTGMDAEAAWQLAVANAARYAPKTATPPRPRNGPPVPQPVNQPKPLPQPPVRPGPKPLPNVPVR